MNTEIIAIIDTSGSMHNIAHEASQGFNQFVAEQREVPGEARLSLYTFNSVVKKVHEGVHLASVPAFRLVPSGMTAMFDGIGQAMEEQGRRIARENWADKVVVCILTDGEENSSRRFTQSRINEMIQHAQAHDWGFVFLAANQDAFAAGKRIGVAAQHTYAFQANAAGATAAYSTMSHATRSLRGTTF